MSLGINQEDVNEREAQIQLMGQVYASAQKTVIWLGEETEEVQHAFRLIEKIRSHYPGFIIAELSNMALYEHQEEFLQATNGFDAKKINSSYDWGPIQELLHRPWFQRKWVLPSIIAITNSNQVLRLSKKSSCQRTLRYNVDAQSCRGGH